MRVNTEFDQWIANKDENDIGRVRYSMLIDQGRAMLWLDYYEQTSEVEAWISTPENTHAHNVDLAGISCDDALRFALAWARAQ